MGVTTSADIEGVLEDPTPEEVLKFRKMQKSELEHMCYSQLQSLRELQKNNKELKEAGNAEKSEELKQLRQTKRDFETLIEDYKDLKARNDLHVRKIDSLKMRLQNYGWSEDGETPVVGNDVKEGFIGRMLGKH